MGWAKEDLNTLPNSARNGTHSWSPQRRGSQSHRLLLVELYSAAPSKANHFGASLFSTDRYMKQVRAHNNSLGFFFRTEIFSKAKTINMRLEMLRKPPSFITNRGIIPKVVSLPRLEIKSWFSNQQAALPSHYTGQLAIPSILLASSLNRLLRVPFP